MTIAYDNALAALQTAATASVNQTKEVQTMAEAVANKMVAIDNSLTNTLIELDNRLRGAELFTVGTQESGDDYELELTTMSGFAPVTELAENDRIQFIAQTTNTLATTISVQLDDLDAIKIENISHTYQIIAGAKVTLTYIDGGFYVTEQVNPKTGNSIRDIGKLIVDSTDTVDIGELAFNGATLNRADYPILWGKIQATSNLIDQASKDADNQTYAGFYGDGDGFTTFSLPILGGEFIRLFDDGRGVDADRGFGSWQEDEFKSHFHTFPYNLISDAGSANQGPDNADDGTQVTQTNEEGGDETRPRNIAYYAKTRF